MRLLLTTKSRGFENPRRFYSTKATIPCDYVKKKYLEPWFVTGFSDAESCFVITIRENPGCNLGWAVGVAFQISLHLKDKEILNELEAFFGGIGSNKQGTNKWTLSVASLKDILKIVEHFDNYPLITQKYGDYLLLREAVMLMLRKEHLTPEGLEKIVAIKASMNIGLSKKLQAAFPNINPVARPLIRVQKIPHPEWVAGFTSGEGCFFLNISKNSNIKLGYRVSVGFQLTQHVRDKQLISLFETYFECGKYYLSNDGRHGDYIVFKPYDLAEKIMPFFRQYKIRGIKELDFQSWCEAIELIMAKKHLTQEGFDRVRQIKGGMNKSRALVDLGSAFIAGTNRVQVKPISVQEVISGKTRNFPSLRAAYLYLSNINNVSRSTISRYLDTGKSVKGFIFSSLKNLN